VQKSPNFRKSDEQLAPLPDPQKRTEPTSIWTTEIRLRCWRSASNRLRRKKITGFLAKNRRL
jgi:hypothetical protein